MIIVSQDKNMIINFNSIVSTYVIKNYVSEEKGYKGYNIDFATNEEINFVLATYETEERAKEVLKEIWKFYEISKRYECSSNNGITIFLEPKFAYQMPER